MSKKKIASDPQNEIECNKEDQVIPEIAKQVIEILKPQLKEFGDSLKDLVQKEVSTLRQDMELKIGSPKVATGQGMDDMMGTIQNILKGLGMDPNIMKQGSPTGQTGQEASNPLAGLMGGGGLGQIDMLMKLLQMVGIGGQQQNPMQGLMMEMMYKNMLAQQYRQSTLMDSIIGSFVKNPDKLAEFMNTQQVLVKDPIEMVAKALGQQGNTNTNTK